MKALIQDRKKVCLDRQFEMCICEAYVEGNKDVVLVTRMKSINKEDLDVEGWIILKLISKKQDRTFGQDSFDSVQGQVVDPCERGN
jgi:hypothetical protein